MHQCAKFKQSLKLWEYWHLVNPVHLSWSCLCTFDSRNSVLSVLRLMLCCLPLCVVLHRVLVHARVSRQQTHVILLTVVADGSSVTKRLLKQRRGQKKTVVGHSLKVCTVKESRSVNMNQLLQSYSIVCNYNCGTLYWLCWNKYPLYALTHMHKTLLKNNMWFALLQAFALIVAYVL